MKNWLKNKITGLARRAGYEIIPEWKFSQLEMAKFVRALFETHNIKTVFDVGANKGQFCGFLRYHVDFTGRVISFEPLRQNIAILNDFAKADKNWSIVPSALGDQNSEKAINVMKRDDMSSFLTPAATEFAQFEDCNVVEGTEIVQVRRLDDMFEELQQKYALEGNYFLKIDTQGFDLRVLRGSVNSLSKIAALQFEMPAMPIYKDMAPMEDYLTFIKEHGLYFSDMFAVSRDPAMRVIEYDCFAINKLYAQRLMNK